MVSRFARWALAALVCTAGAVAQVSPANAAEIGFCGFGNPGQVSGLQLNGAAAESSGVIHLTPNEVFGETGSFYMKTPFPLPPSPSFETQFRVRMYPNAGANGGAGLAFAIQNAGANALGTNGSAMGLDGVIPSVVVELDTQKDGADPNGNHVAVLVGGAPIATANPGFLLSNGNPTDVWVEYDGTTGALRVFVSQTGLKPAAPLLTANVDVYTAVSAAAHGDSAYVGFSAGSSATAKNQHDILSWSIGALSPDTYPIPSGLAACPAAPAPGGSCDCRNTPGPICGRTCNSAADCTVVSRGGKTANVFCNSTTSCTVFCEPGSTCNVLCNSSDCAVQCSAGSTCNVFCNSASCAVTCEPGATCNNAFNSTTAVVNCPAGSHCHNNSCSATDCTAHCAQNACSFAGGCAACDLAGSPGSQCTGCQTDAQCIGTPQTPACQPTGYCGECSATNTARCVGPLGVCNVQAGTCVECNTNADCGGATPICTEHVCVSAPLDGGVADGGLADGGDAGGADGGSLDGGKTDGGANDAGKSDGGRADGGALADAGGGTDGGSGATPDDDWSIEGGGCACNATGAKSAIAPWGALAAAALTLASLRRRRARRR